MAEYYCRKNNIQTVDIPDNEFHPKYIVDKDIMEDDTELKHAPIADVNASGESDSGSYDDEDDEDEYEYEEEDESWRQIVNKIKELFFFAV